MNQKKKIENYQQIAMGTGLRYDEVGGLFHGERDGFDFIVYAPDARYPYMMVLQTLIKRRQKALTGRHLTSRQ